MSELETGLNSDDEDLSNRTWKKFERDLKKQGFREGALKGHEDSFQTGFNLGYSEGFKLGEALGLQKALLSLQKQFNIPDLENGSSLQNISEPPCLLCSEDKKDDIKCIEEVAFNQGEMNSRFIRDFNAVISR